MSWPWEAMQGTSSFSNISVSRAGFSRSELDFSTFVPWVHLALIQQVGERILMTTNWDDAFHRESQLVSEWT